MYYNSIFSENRQLNTTKLSKIHINFYKLKHIDIFKKVLYNIKTQLT